MVVSPTKLWQAERSERPGGVSVMIAHEVKGNVLNGISESRSFTLWCELLVAA